MMISKELKCRLDGIKKVAILGVGSQLRGDDAAGIVAAQYVAQGIKRSRLLKARVFIGATAPENLTGAIKRFKPAHLIIIDAAQMRKRAGAVCAVGVKAVQSFSFGTHNLSLKVLADYLFTTIGCTVSIIGIQPKSVEFGAPVSAVVDKSARRLAKMILCAMLYREK